MVAILNIIPVWSTSKFDKALIFSIPYENEKNIDMCSNPYGKKLLGKYAFPKKTDTIINIIGRKPTLLKYKEKAPHIRAKKTKDMIRINIVIKLKNKFSNGITEYPMIIDIIKK